MIAVIKTGIYQIKHATEKLLILDGKRYFLWHDTSLQFIRYLPRKNEYPLAMNGKYRVYKVKEGNEKTSVIHLELLERPGVWKGYLLPQGLPTESHREREIRATPNCISG